MRNLAFALGVFALAFSASAQTFTAKVVGVHDGDTITVYDGREQTRIRLDGIDCPETGADFSTRAKQLTSGLVFGKQVQIAQLCRMIIDITPRPVTESLTGRQSTCLSIRPCSRGNARVDCRRIN